MHMVADICQQVLTYPTLQVLEDGPEVDTELLSKGGVLRGIHLPRVKDLKYTILGGGEKERFEDDVFISRICND